VEAFVGRQISVEVAKLVYEAFGLEMLIGRKRGIRLIACENANFVGIFGGRRYV
jgi:hypothetical protein